MATQAGSRDKLRGFGRYSANTAIIVEDGYMSQENAQTVLQLTLSSWGSTASTDAELDPILNIIAHALRKGTSAEREWQSVFVTVGGRELCLANLAENAMRYDRSQNPVRVWARSYNKGEMAARTCAILLDPENTIIRQEAAHDYGTSLDRVHLNFDFVEALIKYDVPLTQMDRMIIATNTKNKVSASRSNFIGGTDGGAVQNGGIRVPVAAQVPVHNNANSAASSAARANFSSLR